MIETAALVPGGRDHYSLCLGRHIPYDNRHTRLYDSGLLKCYLLYGISENILVVQSDRSDYTELWHYNISRVQPSSESCLDYSSVYFGPCKIIESHGCGNLEE